MKFDCAVSFSMAKTGSDGTPAYQISITANPGTVIRNNSGQVILTAHVFRGGSELTNNFGGTLNWYKGTEATPIETAANKYTVSEDGTQLTVWASEVAAISAFTCKLE
jgi:hypothetical protein